MDYFNIKGSEAGSKKYEVRNRKYEKYHGVFLLPISCFMYPKKYTPELFLPSQKA